MSRERHLGGAGGLGETVADGGGVFGGSWEWAENDIDAAVVETAKGREEIAGEFVGIVPGTPEREIGAGQDGPTVGQDEANLVPCFDFKVILMEQ
jgi:hypothetical protein